MRGFLFIAFLLAAGCSAPPENIPAEKNSVVPSTLPKTDSTSRIAESPPLPLLVQSGFDWRIFRLEYETLLSAGTTIPGTWRDTAEGFLYRRTLFNFDLRSERDTSLEPAAPIVEFVTWMPGKKILGRKEMDKERLVSIRCKQACKDLENFDLVGMDDATVMRRFGPADTLLPDGFAILRGDELLRVFTKKNKVTSFYWMKLDQPPGTVAEILPATLNFDHWSK